MECVEVVPLGDLLRLRAAESGRKKSGQQQGNDLDVLTSEITPERPFVPRVTRGEKDEIGKSTNSKFRMLTVISSCSA